MGSHGPSWLHDDEPHQIKKWVTQTHTKTATVTTACHFKPQMKSNQTFFFEIFEIFFLMIQPSLYPKP